MKETQIKYLVSSTEYYVQSLKLRLRKSDYHFNKLLRAGIVACGDRQSAESLATTVLRLCTIQDVIEAVKVDRKYPGICLQVTDGPFVLSRLDAIEDLKHHYAYLLNPVLPDTQTVLITPFRKRPDAQALSTEIDAIVYPAMELQSC